MAGIAGIYKANASELVGEMLDKISHRGKADKKIFESDYATIGVVWNSSQLYSAYEESSKICLKDFAGNGHLAKVSIADKKLFLERDQLGVAPLYFGKDDDDNLCFASEVKSLLLATRDINELSPGSILSDETLTQYFHLKKKTEINDAPETIAKNLRVFLEKAVSRRIKSDTFGAWLSGGLDSSAIASIARQQTAKLYTFSAGLKNASDLEFARYVSEHIKSIHKEIIVTFDEMIYNLPKVVYHLESFDALLVRSSIINYFAAKAASDYTEEVFTGEVADELFAGYEYIKSLPFESIADELIDLISRLHNTALQRVDRCANACSIIPHVVFADPDVFNFVLGIPAKYKLNNSVEKWILRQAVKDLLPNNVLFRTKVKFWEGAGVQELISDYASKKITDFDFNNERKLENGWVLNSKEELMYYKIFKEFYGNAYNYHWVGRTKGVTN